MQNMNTAPARNQALAVGKPAKAPVKPPAKKRHPAHVGPRGGYGKAKVGVKGGHV